LSSAIEIVTSYDERDSLKKKLCEAHPLDRRHDRQHDDRLLDVLTEACAFAWAAQVARLGRPHFCFQPGAPDLQLDPEGWVEAKAVHPSEEDQRLSKRMLEERLVVSGQPMAARQGLYEKVRADFNKAGAQLAGRDGPRIVFFNLTALDLPQRAVEEVEEAELDSVATLIQALVRKEPDVDAAAFCHGYLWEKARLLGHAPGSPAHWADAEKPPLSALSR
jgi:hypothetical protein